MSADLFRYRQNTNLKYICLDTETESLNPFYSRPWEICWFVIENNQIISENLRYLHYPDFNISKDAARITKFDAVKYKQKAEDPLKVYKDLEVYLNNPDYYVVGQNIIYFDALQIKNLQNYLKIPWNYSYLQRTYDTLALGRANELGISFPKQKSEIFPWQFRLCGCRMKGLRASLEYLAKKLEIGYDKDKHHQSNYDVHLTNQIFKQLCWKLEVF